MTTSCCSIVNLHNIFALRWQGVGHLTNLHAYRGVCDAHLSHALGSVYMSWRGRIASEATLEESNFRIVAVTTPENAG